MLSDQNSLCRLLPLPGTTSGHLSWAVPFQLVSVLQKAICHSPSRPDSQTMPLQGSASPRVTPPFPDPCSTHKSL